MKPVALNTPLSAKERNKLQDIYSGLLWFENSMIETHDEETLRQAMSVVKDAILKVAVDDADLSDSNKPSDASDYIFFQDF